VDTLSLRRSNDGVAKRSAGLQDKDSGRLVLLCLTIAVAGAASTVEQRHSSIKDLVRGND
jgi:hypothetical protein